VTDDRHYQRISAAIAILISMTEDRDGSEGLRSRMLGSYDADSDLTDSEMALGFAELAAVLLIKLDDRGADPLAVLREIARSIHRPEPGISPSVSTALSPGFRP